MRRITVLSADIQLIELEQNFEKQAVFFQHYPLPTISRIPIKFDFANHPVS